MESLDKKIKEIQNCVNEKFTKDALPALMDYIKIPNLSPDFDKEFFNNGLSSKAAKFIIDWINKQKLQQCEIELLEEKNRSPLVYLDIKSNNPNNKYTVFIYGHYDKQPHFSGWRTGLGPITPVIENEKLYGRGAADDGYAIFSAVTAIKSCQDLKLDHPRCIIMLDGEEESGSTSYMYYVDMMSKKFPDPNLVICLDSGAGNYETLWLTTSMRGILKGDLRVDVLDQGVHSGYAGGIVPSSFRILRLLLERIENINTGELIKDLQVNIPPNKYEEGYKCAQFLQSKINEDFPFIGQTQAQSNNYLQAYFNRTWMPSMEIIGCEGLPEGKTAGNVLRPFSSVRFSIRLPPTLDSKKASEKVKAILEKDVPYKALANCSIVTNSEGWEAPQNSKLITESLQKSCKSIFNNDLYYQGDGMTIPLLGKFSTKWPRAEFIVTGVLGPNSNAHGSNEMLNLAYTRQLTSCICTLLADICAK